MSIIPLWRLRQEDSEFKARLGYIVRPYLNSHSSPLPPEKKKKKKSMYLSIINQ
jgi:hypothetical protein